MAAGINKRLSPVITSALILLMAGICFILLSCSPRQSTVKVEPEGALAHSFPGGGNPPAGLLPGD